MQSASAGVWVKNIPKRWARNGAIFGAIFSYAQYPWSKLPEWDAFYLGSVAISIVGMTITTALIGYVLGFIARFTLRKTSHARIASSILFNWTAIGFAFGCLMLMLDHFTGWRSPNGFVWRDGTRSELFFSIGEVLGVTIGSIVVALLTAFVSRRGFKKAYAIDTRLNTSEIPY